MGRLPVGLVGWEGLGFSRFFLVAYTRTRIRISGANVTMITNRLGDIGLLIAVGRLVGGFLGLECFFGLVAAALTKSAQVPFSGWLPAAIAAPTPVSALVHSRTLVTAGIYLMVRFSAAGNTLLLILGCLTMLVGGVAALHGQDAKKVVALSTLSQLGLIIYTVGGGSLCLALNHLLNHAFFKRLLFLAIGVLIHTNFGRQERRLGRSACSNRNSCIIGIVACLSISGLPCSSGFASKHLIIDRFRIVGGLLLLGGFVGGRVFTILYSGKLLRILVGFSVGQGSIGRAAVGSGGEVPLWCNLICGALVVPCLGLTLSTPSIHTPVSPFIAGLFFLGVHTGAIWHRHINRRM